MRARRLQAWPSNATPPFQQGYGGFTRSTAQTGQCVHRNERSRHPRRVSSKGNLIPSASRARHRLNDPPSGKVRHDIRDEKFTGLYVVVPWIAMDQ